VKKVKKMKTETKKPAEKEIKGIITDLKNKLESLSPVVEGHLKAISDLQEELEIEHQKTIEKVEGLIEKLPRFKANSWEDFDGEHLEHEEDSYGDWVRWSDLNSQLESFKKELKK